MNTIIVPAANQAVQPLLDRWVAENSEVGIHVVAYQGETCVVDAWAGAQDPAAGIAVDPDRTLFNVFSVSKAVTAFAVQLQADRGLIDPDAPLNRYWPEFTGDGRERVTVRHVLSHRSGMHKLPSDITAARIADWDGMIRVLERTAPAFEPGTVSAYQAMTFGWLLGEVVRRTDPAKRSFGRFVVEEIGAPIGAPDLFIGLPPGLDDRVAIMDDSEVQVIPDGTPYRDTCPSQVDLLPATFGRPEIRAAMLPAVGGIFGARSAGRFWAMLANGGTLGGVRLLSEQRARALPTARENVDEPDTVFFGMPLRIANSGFWLGAPFPPISSARDPDTLCCPGMGGSIGFADQRSGLAFAFCHNKLFDAHTPDTDHRTLLADAIRQALGIDVV